jgi:hypothetical protein
MPANGKEFLSKYRPAVSRHWLWLIAGLLWSGVGITLCIMACYWLSDMAWPMNVLGVAAGFGSGVAIYRYGFSRIARKNIRRIFGQPEKVCFFAFQAWRSYLLVAVMVLLGYTLRHSQIHRLILAVIYSGIGTGLSLSSSLYYEEFF